MSGLFDTGLILLLAVVLPGLLLLQAPMARQLLMSEQAPRRAFLYLQSMAMQWILVGVAILVWIGGDRSLAQAGFRIPPERGFWIGAAIVATVGIALSLLSQMVARRLTWRLAFLRAMPQATEKLIPATPKDLSLFLPVAVTAGFCEELLFRGILPALLYARGADLALAGAISAVAFGLMHAYQGVRGVLVTAAMGGLFFALTLLSNSLLPAMALHGLYDWFLARANVAARSGL